MPTAKIPLLGISNAESDNMAPDGTMSELINFRHKDGSVQPVYETKQVISIAGLSYDKEFVHRNAGYANWIGYNTDGGIYWFATGIGSEMAKKTPVTTISETLKVVNIEQMGNIVIITNDEGITYLFFKDDAYALINSFPFPSINFSPVLRSANANPTLTLTGFTDNEAPDFYITIKEPSATDTNTDLATGEYRHKDFTTLKGSIAEMRSMLDKYGWLSGYRFIRYALKLYDGSYIMHSNLMLIKPPRGNDEQFITTYAQGGYYPNGVMIYFLSLYKIYANFAASPEFESLKGIVTGVDVFITQEITKADLDNELVAWHYNSDGSGGYLETTEKVPTDYVDNNTLTNAPMYRFYERTSFMEDIKEVSLFYKIKTFTIDEIVTGHPTNLLIELNETQDILPTYEKMVDDDFTHCQIIPSTTCMYNSKLHIGDLKTKLFKGFSPDRFVRYPNTGTPDSMCLFEVKIRTSEGIKSVFSDPKNYTASTPSVLSAYLCYPDARAESIIVWIKSSSVWTKQELPLQAHAMLNLAYYIKPDLSDITISASIATEPTIDEAYTSTPEIWKASKISNPFYFASENTYSAGARVIAIRSVNESVSEGTAFGTHPLYILTSEGVKLVEVGTASIYYTRTTDGPREVCINGKAIVSLKNGLIIPSDRGLVFISGLTAQCITDQLLSRYSDNLISDERIRVALDHKDITRLKKYSNTYSFDSIYGSLLSICETAYNDKENEVLFMVETPYGDNLCYVWSIDKNLWHVATYKAKNFIKSYDHLYYVRNDDSQYLNIHDIKTETAPMQAFMITRPVKILPDVFKKIDRAILRSQIRLGSETVVFPDNIDMDSGRTQRFLVYGSNDCIRWTLIGGKDHQGSVRMIGTKCVSVSYKYFRFAYAGTPYQVSKLDAIEVSFNESLTNKLR